MSQRSYVTPRVRQERLAKIKVLKEQGKTLKFIALEMGFSTSAISKWALYGGVKLDGFKASWADPEVRKQRITKIKASHALRKAAKDKEHVGDGGRSRVASPAAGA